MTLTLVAPDPEGPATGGTLYNTHLVEALKAADVRCEWVRLENAAAAIANRRPRLLLVDSLHLDALPELRALAAPAPVYLLLHYLPSLVELGREVAASELSPPERAALALADGCVVTSAFMQRAIARLWGAHKPVLCVEPGVALPKVELTPNSRPRGVMLCNLLPAKGVLSLLEALGAGVRAEDDFELLIAGNTDLAPRYAQACRALLEGKAALRGRVRLLGGLSHVDALGLLQTSDVLISASRMEAYGMALAEARAAGVPILARPGGHAAAHVEPEAGGELMPDEAAIAKRWLELVRDPGLLAERKRLAMTARRSRSWPQAAEALVAGLQAAQRLTLREGPR
ncbi:MAG: glycosyltransferase family 4 protein [Polyangiales bacterium]